MGLNIPAPNAGSGAPEVEDGLCIVRFDDLALVEHPDWAVEKDNFGKPDDGQRYHFKATLVDAKGTPVMDARPENEGDAVELEAISRVATGEKSNFRKLLKGVLTAVEFKAWEAEVPMTVDPKVGPVEGRFLNANITHSKSGWPQIESFIGIAKIAK